MTEGMVYEVVDGRELAQRWKVPPPWIRRHCSRDAKDPIPSIVLGRYRRFEWGSPVLTAWWDRRRTAR
jgi:hypothetical protein